MPDALCHVTIHCSVAAEAEPVDVSLPAALPIAELLPWIVQTAGGATGAVRRWHLTDLGGRRLDESSTLAQNDIHDGDLLVLDALRDAPMRTTPVVAAVTTEAPDHAVPDALRIAGCLGASALGILVVAGAGLTHHGVSRVLAAAVLTVVVTAAATLAPRVGMDTPSSTAMSVVAVALAATLGFLIVPGEPGAANIFLAAVAATSMAVVQLRVTLGRPEPLIALVTTAALVAVTAGAAVVWTSLGSTAGAVLAAAAVGLLPLTPRLSIGLAGLTPDVPRPGETADSTDDDAGSRARRGHRILVGLVMGCSAAAALGMGLLAVGGHRAQPVAAVVLAAAVGVALTLRSRAYAAGNCRAALLIGGFAALTVAFVMLTLPASRHGGWPGILAVGAGIALLAPFTSAGPAAVRALDALEYTALAAVVPLACWICGGALMPW